MDKRSLSAERLKIVVFGPYHTGKSSFIRTIDPHARQTEARTTGDDLTTIAIDFGRITIGNRRVYLFGTPGQERFEFVRRLIMQGLDGAFLVVDATTGLHSMHREIQKHLREKGVPVAFLLNKCDICQDYGVIRTLLKEELEKEPVYEISALDPVSSRRALESFVQIIAGARSAPDIVLRTGDHRQPLHGLQRGRTSPTGSSGKLNRMV
jgi:small GTP-binding protein